MSATRTSLTEPTVDRSHGSFADWYDQHPPHAAPVSLGTLPEVVLVRGPGELHPATAGAMAGAVAGPAMVTVAMLLAQRMNRVLDLPHLLSLPGHGAIPADYARPVGWTLAVVLGAAIGSLLAVFARRLRSFAGMISFGIVAAPVIWTALHGIVLPRVSPWLARELPYGPMVIASMVFGTLLAVQVPLRTRSLM